MFTFSCQLNNTPQVGGHSHREVLLTLVLQVLKGFGFLSGHIRIFY